MRQQPAAHFATIHLHRDWTEYQQVRSSLEVCHCVLEQRRCNPSKHRSTLRFLQLWNLRLCQQHAQEDTTIRFGRESSLADI